MFNRAERRAIDQGKGRKQPFIEVSDLDSLFEYSLSICGSRAVLIWENEKRLFIFEQAYSDLLEDIELY